MEILRVCQIALKKIADIYWPCSVPDILLSTLTCINPFNPHSNPNYYHHFIDKETETQRGEINMPTAIK